MATFIDLGPAPTIHLLLSVPVPLAAGGWSWGTLPRIGALLAKEYAYSAAEAKALVHTYGRTVGTLMQRSEASRFMIMAKGPVTGRVIGMREWQWCDLRESFQPIGEYLCGWKTAVKAYWEATGTLIEHQRFCATAGPFSLVSRAHVASAA